MISSGTSASWRCLRRVRTDIFSSLYETVCFSNPITKAYSLIFAAKRQPFHPKKSVFGRFCYEFPCKMRRYVLSEDTIIEESQRVTTMHPLFDAVVRGGLFPKGSKALAHFMGTAAGA